MAGGVEGLTALLPDQHIGRRAHRAGHQHRLSGPLKVRRQLGMPRRQGPGRPLPVDAQPPPAPIDLVRLQLGQVVGHVVHQRQVGFAQDLLEGPPDAMGHDLAIGAAIIRGSCHGRQVARPVRGVDRRAGQLRVGEVDPVGRQRGEHLANMVRADLVTESARPTVDHHRHPAYLQAKGPSDVLVEDLHHLLDFEEVVAGTQAARAERVGTISAQPAARRARGARPGARVRANPGGVSAPRRPTSSR